MLYCVHNDPTFVCTKDTSLVTDGGEITFERDEPVSLHRFDDGRLFVGDEGTVVEVTDQVQLKKLMSILAPATFELGLDENEDPVMVPMIAVKESTLDDKVHRIPIRESNHKTLVTLKSVLIGDS